MRVVVIGMLVVVVVCVCVCVCVHARADENVTCYHHPILIISELQAHQSVQMLTTQPPELAQYTA